MRCQHKRDKKKRKKLYNKPQLSRKNRKKNSLSCKTLCMHRVLSYHSRDEEKNIIFHLPDNTHIDILT